MIIYFSGTGNSKHVAQKIAEATKDKYESIENLGTHINLADNENLGIITPTHWWQLPILMEKYLNEAIISVSKKNYIFLVSTYGSIDGCISQQTRKILGDKNIKLNASFGVKMPDTWTPMFDLSKESEVKDILRKSEPEIGNIISKIKNKEEAFYTKIRLPYFVKTLTRIILENERKTKNFKLKNVCTGCGKCKKSCPAQAIDIKEGKAIWTKEKCLICLRCLHNCPQFAIQYGNKTEKHGQYTFEKYQNFD